MIENQATEIASSDVNASGAKFPLLDGEGKGDIDKIDPNNRPCNHVSHIYHIGTLGAIHQIHHFAPAFDHSTESKLGSIKSPVDELALKDGIRPADESLRVHRPFDHVREAPIKHPHSDPTRAEPTAPKGAPVDNTPPAAAKPVAPSPVANTPQAVEQLSAQLPVSSKNSITITSGSLPVIGDLLEAFNKGNPMEIVNVAKSVKADGISLAGTTSLMGEANVAISADIQPSGDYTFKVDFSSSSLRSFLTLSSLDLPSSFDVSLPETWAIISSKDKILNIIAAAKGSLGEVSIQGTKEETGWEFTAGIDLAASNFSSISVLKPLAAFDDFVGLTDIVMILSSRAAPEFDFPDTDQFGVPDLSWGKIKLPDGAGGLVKGFNLYATLSTAKSEAFSALAKFLKIKLDGSVTIELSVSLPDPETSSKLFITFSENNIMKGLSMNGTVGGVLQDGQVGAELTATANASIQNQAVVFEVNAVAVETGAFITGDMISTGNPLTFTIEGIHFSIAEIGLLIGINDAGIPSLGFSATIDVGNIQASASLFLDSVQPEQSMFAASISRLSYYDVASSIVGQRDIPNALANVLKKIGLEPLNAFTVNNTSAQPLITALDNRDLPTIANFFSQKGISIPNTSDQLLLDINVKGLHWYLTDLSQMLHYELDAGSDGSVTVSLEPQFYCCPQPTVIGSFRYPQGFHVYAKIDYYFIAASVKIEAQGNTGISADVTLDKIIIGHANFLSITNETGETGPQFTMSTYAQGSQPPHISISGAIHVLGINLPSIYLDITEEGVDFDIKEEVSSDLYFELTGSVGDPHNMNLDGKANVQIDTTLDLGELGRVPFKAGVNGSLDLVVKNGDPNASVEGEFEFMNESLRTGNIELDFRTASLKNLAKTFIPYIENAVANDLKGDADKWTGMIKDGAIQGIKGADQIAGVLNSEFKLNASTASKLLSKSGCTADDISNALKSAYKLSPDQIFDTLKQSLGLGENELNDLAGKLGIHGASHTEKIVARKVDHTVDKIGKTFKHIRLETEIAPPATQALSELQKAPALAAEPSVRPAAAPISSSTNPLKVPYFDQLGLADGQRYWWEAFSASSAMLAMYWGKEPNEIVYEKLRRRYADSSSAEAQLDALRSLGLKADFHTDGTTMLLKQEIDAGRPVAVAWLCDGHVSAPSGGGHWSVIVGYDETGFFVNDPYGNCDLVDGGYLSNRDGVQIHYSYQYWVPRWRVEGTGGWMLTCRP